MNKNSVVRLFPIYCRKIGFQNKHFSNVQTKKFSQLALSGLSLQVLSERLFSNPLIKNSSRSWKLNKSSKSAPVQTKNEFTWRRVRKIVFMGRLSIGISLIATPVIPAEPANIKLVNIEPVSSLHIDWTRVSPWLPWMKMRGKPGQLVYSAIGQKVDNFEQLAPLLKTEITERMPLYKQAPRCFLSAKNETSWSYFKKYFQEYLQNKQFPITSPVEKDICED